MPTSVPVTNFDYSSLEDVSLNDVAFVREQTGEIRALMRRATQDIFEIGQKLIQIKKKLGHGNFLAWLEAEFSWTERTARRFISVAEQFASKSDTMTDLDFAPTALYTLASPGLPEEARSEAIERAQAGEFISAKKAQEIKRKYPTKTNKSQKPSSSPSKKTLVEKPVEIIDAELESLPALEQKETFQPPSSTPPTPSTETVPTPEQLQQPSEIKALPPSPPSLWWRLFGKEQKHLLFCGHPDDSEFMVSLPNEVGFWLSSPPTPNQCLCPPQDRVKTAFFYSTIYKGVNLNAIRKLIEGFIDETSSEEDKTAMLAYLPDAPLLLLFEDFGFDCYIAEPSLEQCQKILSVWQQLGGIIEKIDNLESEAV